MVKEGRTPLGFDRAGLPCLAEEGRSLLDLADEGRTPSGLIEGAGPPGLAEGGRTFSWFDRRRADPSGFSRRRADPLRFWKRPKKFFGASRRTYPKLYHFRLSYWLLRRRLLVFYKVCFLLKNSKASHHFLLIIPFKGHLFYTLFWWFGVCPFQPYSQS